MNTTEPIFNHYEIIEDEEYMSDKQLEHFRQILLNWKNNLIAEVNRTVHQMQEASASNFPDPNDRASLEEEVSIELRSRDRERKLIKKIDLSIEKINSKKYGFCTSCKAKIGLHRLEARPTATLCIDCKTKAEVREKSYNH
jgi:DnaK suppressor protein